MSTRHPPANAPFHCAERRTELHAALHQQRQFRLEQLRELSEAAPKSSSRVDDVRDEIDEILRAGATTALAEVEAALNRMRTGTYGICERCTEAIPHERLEVLPMSRYCMRCQRAQEMHPLQQMGPRPATLRRRTAAGRPMTPRITR
jgi:DnaK suppressor protein